jgi:hypothetical protein
VLGKFGQISSRTVDAQQLLLDSLCHDYSLAYEHEDGDRSAQCQHTSGVISFVWRGNGRSHRDPHAKYGVDQRTYLIFRQASQRVHISFVAAKAILQHSHAMDQHSRDVPNDSVGFKALAVLTPIFAIGTIFYAVRIYTRVVPKYKLNVADWACTIVVVRIPHLMPYQLHYSDIKISWQDSPLTPSSPQP